MGDLRLKVAGIVFVVVAVLHLVRFLMKWEVVVAGHAVSLNASLAAFVIAGLLGFWMLKPCCSQDHH